MRRLIPLVLVLALVSLGGCAWFHKQPTVDAQQLAYQHVKKVADVVNAAGQVVGAAQQLEIALYQAGTIPIMKHLAIEQGFKDLAQGVQHGLTVLRDLTKTPMEQQTAITQIGTSMSTFINSLSGLGADAKAKITTLMNGALLIVQGALILTS